MLLLLMRYRWLVWCNRLFRCRLFCQRFFVCSLLMVVRVLLSIVCWVLFSGVWVFIVCQVLLRFCVVLRQLNSNQLFLFCCSLLVSSVGVVSFWVVSRCVFFSLCWKCCVVLLFISSLVSILCLCYLLVLMQCCLGSICSRLFRCSLVVLVLFVRVICNGSCGWCLVVCSLVSFIGVIFCVGGVG